MKPYSLSASAIQVAQGCLARYHAEYILRGRGMQNSAASVGTICHGVLENVLRAIYIRKDPDAEWTEEYFLKVLGVEYEKELGTDQSRPEYEDAKSLVLRWMRNPEQKKKLDSCRIVSLEAKNNFPVKTTAGTIPFNYIMDRLDQTGPKSWRVVDYKSNRIALTPQQLHKKPQARLYALAVQILHKDAEEIWVEFDFLRHGPVGTKFTREDNVETWKMLRSEAQRIVDTPESRPPETLNKECNWCVRKASCKTLQKNVGAGGIFSQDIETLAKQYAVLKYAMDGQKALMDEIEMILLATAAEHDVLEIDTEAALVEVTGRVTRDPMHEQIAAVLGPQKALEIAKFRTADIDKLIKSGELDEHRIALLNMFMPKKMSEMSVKVHLKET